MKCIHRLLKGREQELIQQKIQRAMAKEGADYLLLVRCDNIFYATGFRSNFAYQYGNMVGDTIAVVPRQGRITLIVNNLEEDNAQTTTEGIAVKAYLSGAFIDDGSVLSRSDKTTDIYAALKLAMGMIFRSEKHPVIATEMMFLSHGLWTELQQYDAELINAESIIMSARRIKTAWEIETLASAVRLTEKAWNLVAADLKEGMNAIEINRRFKKYTWENDPDCAVSDDQFIPAVGKFIGLGTIPRDYKLQNGDVIKFDAGFRYCGYTSDIARTLGIGRVSDKAERIYDILYRANRTGASMLKPGVKFSEVYQAVRNQVEQSELIPYYPRGNVGHAIGVSTQICETPMFTKNNDEILEPGMVLTLETPYSGWKDAPVNAGYNIEDCYVITETGCIQFTTAPSTIYWGK